MPMIKQHEAPSLLAQSPSPDTTTKREREEEKGRKEKSSSVPGLETKTHWYILAKSLPGEENLCSRAEFGSLKQVPRNESHHSYMKSDGTRSGRGNESDSGADADVAGAVRQQHWRARASLGPPRRSICACLVPECWTMGKQPHHRKRV